MIESRYALREVVQDRLHGYAVKHPESGEIVSNRSFKNGYCEQPLTFLQADAQALAEALRAQTQVTWVVELAPGPCPQCGRVIWADDLDFCYPANRERTRWRAGCNEHDFGCGYNIEGDTFESVIRRWNGH